MYQNKIYEIKSTDDIELNIKRESKLEFKVSFDDEKEMKAFYSAILIFEETPNASPISAIKNSTDVPP